MQIINRKLSNCQEDKLYNCKREEYLRKCDRLMGYCLFHPHKEEEINTVGSLNLFRYSMSHLFLYNLYVYYIEYLRFCWCENNNKIYDFDIGDYKSSLLYHSHRKEFNSYIYNDKSIISEPYFYKFVQELNDESILNNYLRFKDKLNDYKFSLESYEEVSYGLYRYLEWIESRMHNDMLEECQRILYNCKREEERRIKELERKLKDKKYNYVYIITDLTNLKKYIGKHSTNNMDDGYMGSGVLLRQKQYEHGIENFVKEIIHMCDSEQNAFELERYEIEKVKAYENEDYYNLI